MVCSNAYKTAQPYCAIFSPLQSNISHLYLSSKLTLCSVITSLLFFLVNSNSCTSRAYEPRPSIISDCHFRFGISHALGYTILQLAYKSGSSLVTASSVAECFELRVSPHFRHFSLPISSFLVPGFTSSHGNSSAGAAAGAGCNLIGQNRSSFGAGGKKRAQQQTILSFFIQQEAALASRGLLRCCAEWTRTCSWTQSMATFLETKRVAGEDTVAVPCCTMTLRPIPSHTEQTRWSPPLPAYLHMTTPIVTAHLHPWLFSVAGSVQVSALFSVLSFPYLCAFYSLCCFHTEQVNLVWYL